MGNPSDITKLIQEKTYRAYEKGVQIQYIWIPGRIGILGNEKADQETIKAT